MGHLFPTAGERLMGAYSTAGERLMGFRRSC